MPKTKIVCTIGPSSESPEIIKDLMQKGMNVARLNFSHGTHKWHREKIALIRSLSDELNIPVAILQDLSGPKIRIGDIPEPGIQLEPGQRFVLTAKKIMGTGDRVSVSYPELPAEVKKGDRILLADGLMELVVEKSDEENILCEVITGGLLTSHKGLNLPTGTIRADSITEKDKTDLALGLECNVDYIALSFVKSADDIIRLKDIIHKAGKSIPVIAKIEKHEALGSIDNIIEAADAIMVARGDLGVEIPLEEVPSVQKDLVSKANQIGKPVIIATQMLRSMVTSPRPTRAEAADVANAVLDGTDAIMLSEETASGAYPVKAVEYMVRIARSAEAGYPHERYLLSTLKIGVSKSVAHASCVLADHLDATAIVATTRSGATALHIARYRPRAQIVALSMDNRVLRMLALVWGCIPAYLEYKNDFNEMIDEADRLVIRKGYAAPGDLLVITAGHPISFKGDTNMLKVEKL